MNVDIRIARSMEVPVPVNRVTALLKNYEQTLRRFPKLRKLTRIDDGAYLSEMAPIGSRMANIAHEVRYAARYAVDPERGVLSWTPLPGHGNAQIRGRFELQDRGTTTELSFEVQGRLHDVPVPLVYRLVAPPFIQGKFTRLVDVFLEQTRDALI